MNNVEAINKAEHERIWLEPSGAPDRCWCQDNQWGDDGVEYVLASNLEALQRENQELKKKISGCDWYWPEEDTSSDACADGPWQIAETYDLKPADVMAYSRGGVVETRYFAFLPPADDSDSDDNFEIDEATEDAVVAKITAEIERRTDLASAGEEHHAE